MGESSRKNTLIYIYYKYIIIKLYKHTYTHTRTDIYLQKEKKKIIMVESRMIRKAINEKDNDDELKDENIIEDEYTDINNENKEFVPGKGCAFVAVDEISDTNVLCTAWTSVIGDCSKDGDKDNKSGDKDGDKDKTKNKDNEDGNDTDDTAELYDDINNE